MNTMKGKALLFGLNYSHSKSGKLNGCINDVFNISQYIRNTLAIPIVSYTDDVDLANTSYDGIIKNLHSLAIDTYKENLDFVWIHYSGHGSYQIDISGDEKDGMDEGLVPSDYEKKGILIDDIINHMISSFNPKTKIVFVCDSCHSGSMLDLKYTWTDMKLQIDNKNCAIRSNTILISGCMDNQTSTDAFNLLGDNQSIGALTASILKVLKNKPGYIYDVFSFVDAIRGELKKGGFSQYPILSSNYDLTKNPSMIPVISKRDEIQIPSESSAFIPIKPSPPPEPPKLYNPSSYYRPLQYYESNNTYNYYRPPQPPHYYYQNNNRTLNNSQNYYQAPLQSYQPQQIIHVVHVPQVQQVQQVQQYTNYGYYC